MRMSSDLGLRPTSLEPFIICLISRVTGSERRDRFDDEFELELLEEFEFELLDEFELELFEELELELLDELELELLDEFELELLDEFDELLPATM